MFYKQLQLNKYAVIMQKIDTLQVWFIQFNNFEDALKVQKMDTLYARFAQLNN